MKGYVKIKVESAIKSLSNYKEKDKKTKKLLLDAIDRYYLDNYTNGSWWQRLGCSKKTPYQFAASKLDPFGTFDDLLVGYLTQSELDDIWRRSIGFGREQSDTLQNLVEVSENGFIIIDDSLSGFIRNYTDDND